MDIAAMSIILANSQVRQDASLAMVNKAMGLMEQQGQQLMELMNQSVKSTPHPSLGNKVDIKA